MNDELKCQLTRTGEHSLEYKLMKKSRSINMRTHELGRRMTAENGAPARVAMCIDITELKQAQAELLRIYNNILGAIKWISMNAQFLRADDGKHLYCVLVDTPGEKRLQR